MSQQVTVVHNAGWISQDTFKTLWRFDAVLTLLSGDLLIFAPGTVIEFMGMTDDATPYVRALGVIFALYGLWALWAARSGSISKRSYWMAVADMDVMGIAAFAAVLLGVQFNDVGTAIVIGIGGIGAWLLAGFWYLASRQAE